MQELKPYMHYPNLKTILAVEAILKKDDELMSRNEIMRRLDNKIQRQTLNIVLEYLHESGKITESKKLKELSSRLIKRLPSIKTLPSFKPFMP